MNVEKGSAFKPPYPGLGLLPFLVGGLFYAAISLSGRNPGLGVQMGLIVAVITWFFVRYLQARAVLQQLEEELRAGNAANARAMLAYVRPRILVFRSMVRKYLELRTMAALQTAIDVEEPSSSRTTGGEADPGDAPGRMLSWPAVVLICLAPFVFLPLFLLALLGLNLPILAAMPAAAGAILAFYLINRGRARYDSVVARWGLLLFIMSLAATIVAGWSTGIPQPVPEPLASDFLNAWPDKIAQFLILAISIILHECAHGVAAYFSGDPTARNAGRISLNPVRHIDPIGTILLPALLSLTGGVIFGWAKPVPVDPSRFNHARRGRLAVSLAGVGANLFLAFFCWTLLIALGVTLHLQYPAMQSAGFWYPLGRVVLTGIPQAGIWQFLIGLLKWGIYLNLILFNLNILPLPPLDGFGVLESLLPASFLRFMHRIRGLGAAILLVLFLTNALDFIFKPGINGAIILNSIAGILTKLG